MVVGEWTLIDEGAGVYEETKTQFHTGALH
jgi:hypothetical protein